MAENLQQNLDKATALRNAMLTTTQKYPRIKEAESALPPFHNGERPTITVWLLSNFCLEFALAV